jgi:hypothetical protein
MLLSQENKHVQLYLFVTGIRNQNVIQAKCSLEEFILSLGAMVPIIPLM